MPNRRHKPWIMRLPRGLREQPAWIFIGAMIGLAGVSYLTGLTESSVSRAVGPVGLQIWGAILAVSGFGLVFAVIHADPILERLTLRGLSVCIIVYLAWLFTIVEWDRLVMSAVLVLILVFIAEIRIAVLKVLISSLGRGDQSWE